MTLVAKVKDKAGGLYTQAKTRYAGNEQVRKAGEQAGNAASQAAVQLKQLAARTTAAVKDARSRGITPR